MADCPNRDKTCDICGKTGHLKIKCRMEARQTEKSAPRDRRGEGKDSRGRSDASKTCNNCGEVGHRHAQCPKLDRELNIQRKGSGEDGGKGGGGGKGGFYACEVGRINNLGGMAAIFVSPESQRCFMALQVA